jgi:hypothetical protein
MTEIEELESVRRLVINEMEIRREIFDKEQFDFDKSFVSNISALKYIAERMKRIDDLVVFCNTGKYPDE